MATFDIPTSGGTYTVNSGDIFNIPAGATGNIVINGAADFTVNIGGDLTGGGGDNLGSNTFGTESEPTVNIPVGVDSSPYVIDANGENLTVNIGDGAIVADNITGSNQADTFTIGDNPNGSATDLIRIGAWPDQQAAFDTAGWVKTRDGTNSSPSPAFNGSPALRIAGVMEVSV